jgi:hypothetical protein
MAPESYENRLPSQKYYSTYIEDHESIGFATKEICSRKMEGSPT